MQLIIFKKNKTVRNLKIYDCQILLINFKYESMTG